MTMDLQLSNNRYSIDVIGMEYSLQGLLGKALVRKNFFPSQRNLFSWSEKYFFLRQRNQTPLQGCRKGVVSEMLNCIKI